MYRLTSESLLGITLEVDRLHLAPLLPAGWDVFTLRYRYRDSAYLITVRRGVVAGLMVNDGGEHSVELVVG